MALDVRQHLDLGNVMLPLGCGLDEIVVKSARNVASCKNDLLHISVRQTYLSELPNAESLLGKMPGVFLANNPSAYFGKGQILLLVNGREVKSWEEVSALQPLQVTEIVADNMPGERYDLRYASVADSKTVSEKPDLMIYNMDTRGRHYSGPAGFTSRGKVKNALIDFACGFRKRKDTWYPERAEENFRPDSAFKRVFMDTAVPGL